MSRQRNIPWLGAFTESFYNALPLLTGVNFLLIMAAAYDSVHSFVSPLLPWFNFTWFVVFMISSLAVMTVLTYKFIVPSLNTFRYGQMNKFDSPVLREIEKLEKEVKSLRESLSKESLSVMKDNGLVEFDVKTSVNVPGTGKEAQDKE